MASDNKKIGLISSCGGHLGELRTLQPVYGRYAHFYVLNDLVAELPEDMKDRTYFIQHSERDALFIVNLWEAWRILRRERPHLLVSTGAGPMVPFALIGKLLGIRILFIEIGTQVISPSVTGRILYFLADRFFYQWKPLARFYPKATYGGTLL